jgi:L-ribulose-5-phosphate 3-epimerase
LGVLLHTMATPDHEPLGAIRLAAELGFDGVELICQANYGCGIEPAASLDDARALGIAARHLGAPIIVLSPYEKRIADEDENVRATALGHLEHVVCLAAAMGARGVRILAGEEVADDEFPAALSRLAASLRLISDVAAPHSITLLIENHMDTMAISALRTVAICEAVARPNVRILFDPANLATLKAEGFLDALVLQARYIGHVHVKDAIVEGGVRKTVIPGEGLDPWAETIAALSRCGFEGDYAIEYEKRWLHDLPSEHVALPKALSWLRSMENFGNVVRS